MNDPHFLLAWACLALILSAVLLGLVDVTVFYLRRSRQGGGTRATSCSPYEQASRGLPSRVPFRGRWLVPAACAAILAIPIGHCSLAEFFRGLMGDVSVTTMLLLAVAVAWQVTGTRLLPERDWRNIFACAAVAGLALYPMTLGLGSFDPYTLGFRPIGLLGVLLVLAVWGFLRGGRAAFLVPLIVLAWLAGILESANLWDYLIDPFVAIFSLGWLAVAAFRKLHPPARREAKFGGTA